MVDHSPDKTIKTDRDNHLWLKLWRNRQTDFHQKKVNKLLTSFWPSLNLLRGSRVFVPLCGKSLDMIWLAKEGHEVIGVELSAIAIKSFFHENRLKPVKRRMGRYTLWKHGRISILCGDYFSLKVTDLGRIDTVYDRAALTALPEDIRKRYAEHLQQIAPQADIFLLTVEDIEYDLAIEQVTKVDKEIGSLFANEFNIELTHFECVNDIDHEFNSPSSTQAEYKLYLLSNKSR